MNEAAAPKAVHERGWYGFSDAEFEALAQFRAKIPAELDTVDDVMCMRFIRARKMDLNAAMEMFIKCMAWRKNNHIDDMLAHMPPNQNIMVKVSPQKLHGVDREGHPIYIHKIGRMHLKQLVRFSPEAVMECHCWQQEHIHQAMHEASVKYDRNISKSVIILDVAGLSLEHRQTMKFGKFQSYMDANFYPESLHKMIIINAPSFAALFWRILKPWLDPVTVTKVSILGKDFLEEVSKFIDPANLPREMGGTCNSCPQVRGGCIAEFPIEEVAEDMKLFKEPRAANLVTINVSARSAQEVPFTTENPLGADFSFRFRVSKDIQFSATFLAKDADEKGAVVVVPLTTVNNTEVEPLFGQHISKGPGTLKLIFNNKFSWFTAKQVDYQIDIIENTVPEVAQDMPVSPRASSATTADIAGIT